jgi:hypothetical protein
VLLPPEPPVVEGEPPLPPAPPLPLDPPVPEIVLDVDAGEHPTTRRPRSERRRRERGAQSPLMTDGGMGNYLSVVTSCTPGFFLSLEDARRAAVGPVPDAARH